ncbi:MAG: hypothetical protein IIB26_08335 [Chloroflexi bacterium]|nr:hypothetical protein [Chloroflexota bacterium]
MSDTAGESVNFDLPGREYEQVTWLHNEHGAASVSPLALTVRVRRNSEDHQDGLPGSITVNGYAYNRADHWPPESTLSDHLQGEELPEDDADLQNWRERCLPLVEEVCAEIDAFDPGSVPPGGWRKTIEAQQKRIREVGRYVHDTAVFPAQLFAETFAKRYAEVFGDEKRTEGLALLQGFPNVSTGRAAALWDLGRIARRSLVVMSALESGALPEGNSAGEVEFRDGFKTAMELYGLMNPMMMEDRPTWREDIAMPLGIVRTYASEDDQRDPRSSEQTAIEFRQMLEVALAEKARDSVEVAELLRILPYAQHIGPVTEDHNMLADQRMMEASRGRWLKVGEMLRSRGAVERADDVYFYELEELLSLLEDGVSIGSIALAERRDRQAQWRLTTPPAVLGKGALGDGTANAGDVVIGMAAAAGSYRGRARVITSITEADTLEEGDVLVCDVTTPAWTPYFAVIGAVVTNIGSVLAHGAIVAREFGIPAVVATGNGTSLIPDGATVTVNGTAGTVTVEPD